MYHHGSGPALCLATVGRGGEFLYFLEDECRMVHPLDGFAIFDDKGEVKRLVAFLIQARDPQVTIDTLRKLDYSYIFTLSKRGRSGEVELIRPEIEAS